MTVTRAWLFQFCIHKVETIQKPTSWLTKPNTMHIGTYFKAFLMVNPDMVTTFKNYNKLKTNVEVVHNRILDSYPNLPTV